MSTLDLSAFKALTFDCYGTLIDWEAGLLAVLRPWARRHGVDLGDDELLAVFARHEPRCQAETAAALYPDILRAVQSLVAAELGIEPSAADADELARSVGDWPAFPDTHAALTRLAERFRLVVLSNVDRASFARSRERLGVDFDAVVTAEDLGRYKPDPLFFEQALEILKSDLGVERHEVLHVAQSLFHDHVPAQALGLRTVWIDRRAGLEGWGATAAPPSEVRPDLTVSSLAALAALV